MISHTALCQNALAPFRNEGVLLCLFFKHFCREYNNIIQCCSLIVADILKLNSNLSMRKKFLPRVYDPWLFLCLQQVNIWFSWVQILFLYQWIYFEKKIFRCFVGSDPLEEGMDLFWKGLFVNNL